MKGSRAASFRGSLDAVAIHREIVSDADLKARFRRVGGAAVAQLAPAVMPDLGPLPAGRVVAMFHEGMPAQDRWLTAAEKLPGETLRWSGREFLLPRLPLRYDDWGIRASWRGPVLTRLAGDVALPPGRHRVVLRARGLSRLWMDGALVTSTKPPKGDAGGHDPITPVPTPPLPGLSRVGFGVQEVFGDVTVKPGSPVRVVLETLVGGKRLRAEPGELVVAVQTADGRSFHVLQTAGEPVALTESAVAAGLAGIEASLGAFDDQNRRAAAATQDAFWRERHRLARVWAEQASAAVGAPHARL